MFFWKTAKETVPERPIRISSVEWRDGEAIEQMIVELNSLCAEEGK